MNRKIFNDALDEQTYRNQGYLHVKNFLSADEINSLRKVYYDKEYSRHSKGFHRTLDLSNAKDKLSICSKINNIVLPRAKKYLYDYRYLLTSFMTKEYGADAFDIHQNWSFVDERYFTSLVLWIPLQDTNEDNGTMYFIPKSDRMSKGVRGNNIRWMYDDIKLQLLPHLVPVNMSAGDVVIFDDATIHYTSPNKSTQPRISIAQVMIPDEAQPVFYNVDVKRNKLQKFAIDNDFYHLFTNRYLPKQEFNDVLLLNETDFDQKQMPLTLFEEQYKRLQ